MNFEMCMAITKLLEEIRNEIHTQNVINAERNMALEYLIPYDINLSCELLPCTREFLNNNNNNAKGAPNV